MTSFRFLHAADLHIDSPLRGLEADHDAPAGRIRTATRAAYSNLVDLALTEQVAFVLVSGDLFDGEWQDWRTGQFFAQETARLTRAGIRVFCIRGNHDAASVVTGRLALPDGARMLSTDRPDSIRLAELNVVIHGMGFSTRAVSENVVPRYPSPIAGHLNVGMLHTSATDSGTHETYAPCTVEQLAAHGYDYWALGHVHARQELASRPCWIVFPGNTQGRHIRETGPKGATLVTVDNGRITDVTHRDLDVVRWALLPVDLSAAATEDEAFALVRAELEAALDAAGDRLLAARVVLHGATPAHPALVRDLGATRDKLHAESASCAGTIWLESVEVRTRTTLDREAMRARSDAVGLLVRELDNAVPAHFAAEVQAYCATLLNRSRVLREALGEDHPAVLAAGNSLSPELLERARNLLLARLAEG
jgi:DNA repair exonuclease SbcCD nuclease subunit